MVQLVDEDLEKLTDKLTQDLLSHTPTRGFLRYELFPVEVESYIYIYDHIKLYIVIGFGIIKVMHKRNVDSVTTVRTV